MQEQANQSSTGGADSENVSTVVQTVTEQLLGYWEGLIKSLPNIAIVLVLLGLTGMLVLVLKNVVGNTMQRANIRRALIELTKTLISVFLWVLAILISMSILFPSVKPSSVLTALGVGGLAIGFAFKDIFENFMAGAMIMLRKPMRIGDFIKCEGVEGSIEDISIRDTYMRQTDGQLVVMPNSILFKNPVYIRTHDEIRRYDITVGIAYDEDVDEARDVIRAAVEKMDNVAKDRPIEVFVKEFNSSSVDFNVRWWAESTPLDMHESRDQVMTSIKRALDKADIEIPFPYRTLTFKQPLALANEQQDERSGEDQE